MSRYLVTSHMQSDLSKALKLQRLTDKQVQLLVYQILRGLKVTMETGACMLLFYFPFSVYPLCWSATQGWLLFIKLSLLLLLF